MTFYMKEKENSLKIDIPYLLSLSMTVLLAGWLRRNNLLNFSLFSRNIVLILDFSNITSITLEPREIVV